MLDHWNMSTMIWLRYVVYERWRSVTIVFFFSAFWHGFYAGYYLTFLGAALFLETSRLVRGLSLERLIFVIFFPYLVWHSVSDAIVREYVFLLF